MNQENKLPISKELLKQVDHALAWADENCTPEARKRLRSRQVAAILASEVRTQREQLSALRKELLLISIALDDPRTDLTMTMVEIIEEMKSKLSKDTK